jgi:SulP family sulfate permease
MNKPKASLTKFLPILEWLPRYKKEDLPGDLTAGLTVGVMLIPQGMAYAMLAGLAPVHGLYAVTVPLILYALFGSSRHLAVGPDAIISMLTAAGIAALQTSTDEEYLLYVLTLTLMVGIIRLAMGLMKLGFVVNFLSRPVINGFTSAAAVVIGLSQVGHLLGIELPQTMRVQEMISAIAAQMGHIHWPTLGIGAFGIVVIIFGKKLHPFLPSQLLAIVVGVVLVAIFHLNNRGTTIVGDVPGGFPKLSMPYFGLEIWE